MLLTVLNEKVKSVNVNEGAIYKLIFFMIIFRPCFLALTFFQLLVKAQKSKYKIGK